MQIILTAPIKKQTNNSVLLLLKKKQLEVRWSRSRKLE